MNVWKKRKKHAKEVQDQVVDDHTLYMGRCWDVALPINVLIWAFYGKISDTLHLYDNLYLHDYLCLHDYLVVLIILWTCLLTIGLNLICGRRPSTQMFLHMLVVTASLCFVAVPNWPVWQRALYVVGVPFYCFLSHRRTSVHALVGTFCLLLSVAPWWHISEYWVYLRACFCVVALLFICIPPCGENEVQTPPEAKELGNQEEKGRGKKMKPPPEGLCWTVDVGLFVMWVANPIRQGLIQIKWESADANLYANQFLIGLIDCYLRTVLYFSVVIAATHMDVCRFTRQSPELQHIRTIAYFENLNAKIDHDDVSGGSIWYAYQVFKDKETQETFEGRETQPSDDPIIANVEKAEKKRDG